MTTQNPPLPPEVVTRVQIENGASRTHVWTDAAGVTHASLYLDPYNSLEFHDRAQVRDLIARLAALAGEMDAEITRQLPTVIEGFLCDCGTNLTWPAKNAERICPACGITWEHDGVDLGAGVRIKYMPGVKDQTSPSASSGPGVVPSLVPAPSERDSDVQPDPYIDAIAAEHIQEYEPALAEPLLVCALCGATDVVLMCVSGPRCHNQERCAERAAAQVSL